MLGIWTVVELLLIVAADMDPSITGWRMPSVAEMIRSNGALLPFALLYCAWQIALSTLAPTISQLRDNDK